MMPDGEQTEDFLEELGKSFVPNKYRPTLRVYLAKGGLYSVPYKVFTILFFLVVASTAAIYFGFNIFSFISDNAPVVVGIYAFLFWTLCTTILTVVIMAGFYFYINMKIYGRMKEIEMVLPDYLVLVSTNLKGGLSFERSLWASIKSEFGILADEMSYVSKRVMTGSDLSEALTEFAQKYDSPTLKRTLSIIVGELESGGKIASVLDQSIDILRKTKLIKDEMAANTLMFTIFIGAIVMVISPLLFALAFNLLSILINVMTQIAPALQQGTSSVPFKFEAGSLKVDDFKVFSSFALSIIAIFASMILSIIQRGDIKSGVRYIPFFVAVAVLLYQFFLIVLGAVFTTMI